MMPPMAMSTPTTLLSPTARPDVIQPRATIEHVLTWPTTVEETGPVWAMMKNWDMLIMQAKKPDCFEVSYPVYRHWMQFKGRGALDCSVKGAYHEYHKPAVGRYLGPNREGIHERNNIKQHKRSQRCLVKEQLHAVHLELLVIARNPNRIQRTGKNPRKCKDNPQAARRLDIRICSRQRIVIRYHSHTQARRNQSDDGIFRQCRFVENEVHERNNWREEDSSHLVEGYGREGEREVREDDVECHGDRKRHYFPDGYAAGNEHGEPWAGECEEREPCHEEVKGGESELCELEGGVGEDGFVCEDLGESLVLAEKRRWSSPQLTIPIVAKVLTTIHMTAVLVELSAFGGSVGFSSSGCRRVALSMSSPISNSSGFFNLKLPSDTLEFFSS